MEVSLLVIVSGFLILGALAYLNSRELVKDLPFAQDDEERRFVCEELFRARLRAAGWFLLFATAMVRLSTEGATGDAIGAAVGVASIASFLADGIRGRLERRRMLRRR